MNQWLNRLAKWRMILAGWQLGTRPKEDPECQAVRDHRESTLIQRAELSALTNILIMKGVFTLDDYKAQLEMEAEMLCSMMSQRFPGFEATDNGMKLDPKLATQTMKGWKP